jgi:enterochelin esterase-like enzyme
MIMRKLIQHRFSVWAAVLLAAMVTFVPLRAQSPAVPNPNDTLKSPEVLSDHRVAFRIYAPKASEVTLTGDWIESNHRNVTHALKKDAQGVWSTTEGPLVPDFYLYSFTVDGVPTLDPKNHTIKHGPASLHNIFEVPGPETAFEDDRVVPHGYVNIVWYYSGVAGGMRRMHVYTPPGYDSETTKYPVFYLLHGGGDNDTGWTTGGRANFILDNLIAEGKAKPMIVVMPDFNISPPQVPGTATPVNSQNPSTANNNLEAASRQQDTFGTELVTVIIPYVEQNFRVIADRENRAMAGLSMGGARTLRVAPSRLDLFSYIGVFSMGLQKGPTQGVADDFEGRNAKFLKNPQETNKLLKLFWIGVGNQDDRITTGGKVLSEMLTQYGIKNEYHESTGGHSWINWRRYLNEFAPRLFR